MLARRVSGLQRERHGAFDGTDPDEGAARVAHLLDGDFHGMEHADEVDVEDLPKLVRVDLAVFRKHSYAGKLHPRIDPAELGDGEICESPNLCLVAGIGDVFPRFAAGVAT